MKRRRSNTAKGSTTVADVPTSKAGAAAGFVRSDSRWLLLIHQIPPKPDYLRVKISRRLQRIGAIAIKNSVYALPPTAEAYEDFQWIAREIEEGGGDAFISEASLLGDGLTDSDVRARFDAVRNHEYDEILADARSLLNEVRPSRAARGRRGGKRGDASRPSSGRSAEHELAKLRRRYEAVQAIDFFGAANGSAVSSVVRDIQHALQGTRGARKAATQRPIDGATWVTRSDVHVDRIASAWLVHRFIDRRPRFRFVDPKRYTHVEGELRFDMFEAEYTHVGDACTFEMLVSAFVPGDAALREIAEVVHDVDCKDAKFGRAESAGLARMISGIALLCDRDEDRLERGRMLFDDLYAAFGGDAQEKAT